MDDKFLNVHELCRQKVLENYPRFLSQRMREHVWIVSCGRTVI